MARAFAASQQPTACPAFGIIVTSRKYEPRSYFDLPRPGPLASTAPDNAAQAGAQFLSPKLYSCREASELSTRRGRNAQLRPKQSPAICPESSYVRPPRSRHFLGGWEWWMWRDERQLGLCSCCLSCLGSDPSLGSDPPDEFIRAAENPQSRASHTLVMAGLSGFLTLSHVRQRPCRYGASRRFDTMPSNPNRQACANTTLPGASTCSVS